MLYPVIDIGSNTVKIAIYDSDSANQFTPFFFKSYPLKLGESRSSGCLERSALEKLSCLLNTYIFFCEEKGCADRLKIFATASLRGIRNTTQVKKYIKDNNKYDITILSGNDEARYSLKGICAIDKVKSGLAVDMGGGSTEFISFENGEINNAHSFKFGILKLNEILLSKGASPLQSFICRKLCSMSYIDKNRLPLIACGGSARALLAAKKIIHGGDDTITKKQLYTFVRDVNELDQSRMTLLEGTVTDRMNMLETISAVFYTFMKAANVQSFTVTKGGVREGFVYQWMKEENTLKEQEDEVMI